nr:hypothetical protein Iba_chr13fCG6170 [Ipomoea batatas]
MKMEEDFTCFEAEDDDREGISGNGLHLLRSDGRRREFRGAVRLLYLLQSVPSQLPSYLPVSSVALLPSSPWKKVRGGGGRVTWASSSDSRLSRNAAPPPLAPVAAPALAPRALTPPPRGDPTWARGVCRNILSSHDPGSRGVNEASARLVEALLGCTNVFDEFEASKEHVSELEKRLAFD